MSENKTHIPDQELERYFDGELSGSKAAEIKDHIESCKDCCAKLQRMENLGRMIRFAAEENAESFDEDAFLANVRKGIEKDRQVPLSETLKVWLEEFFSFRKQIWVPSAVAVTAAVLVMVVSFSQPVDMTPEPYGNSNVASVSFDSGSGIVFQVEEDNGSTTAVVWVNE